MTDRFSSLQALCQLLASSFGPLGLDKIVANDMQQVLCTTSGSEILPVLHPTDPLLGMTVRSAQEFAAKHGDGSKRLLMMTAAGARQALLEAEGAGGSWHGTLQPSFARLCHSLAALQGSGYVTQLAQQVAEALTVPVSSSPHDSADNPLNTLGKSAHQQPGSTTAEQQQFDSAIVGRQQQLGSAHAGQAQLSSTIAVHKHLTSTTATNQQPASTPAGHQISFTGNDTALKPTSATAPQQLPGNIPELPHHKPCTPSPQSTSAWSIDQPNQTHTSGSPDVIGEAGAVRRLLKAILTTSFTNRLGRPAVQALVDLLMDLIMSHLSARSSPCPAPGQQHSHDPDAVANFPANNPSTHHLHACGTTLQSQQCSPDTVANFPGNKPSSAHHHHAWWTTLHALAVHTPLCQAPGLSVSASRLLKGVLLHNGMASKHMELPSAGTRFAVLNCSLDSPSSDLPSRVRVTSSRQYQQLLQGAGDQLVAALQVLAGTLRVGLLVCTHRCSDLVVFRCLEAGLVLAAGVEEEEALALCRAAGIQAVTSCAPAVLKEADVGEATSVEELSLGAQQKGLLIGLAKCGGTALVCGPSEGLCKQYAKCMVAGLKLLESACVHVTPAHKPASTTALSASPLPALPGGGAFDAALAAVLSRHMELLHMGFSPASLQSQGPPSLLDMHSVDVLLAKVLGMETRGHAQGAWSQTTAKDMHRGCDQAQVMGARTACHAEGGQLRGEQGCYDYSHTDATQKVQACCEQPHRVQNQEMEQQWHWQWQQQQHVQSPESPEQQQQQQDQQQQQHAQHEHGHLSDQGQEKVQQQRQQEQQQCAQLELERRQLLLPGVRVLHAIACAVPQALARTAQGQEVASSIPQVVGQTAQGQEMVNPEGARSSSPAPTTSACSHRAPLLLVHELRQHAQKFRDPVGLVVPKAALHKIPRPGWPGKTVLSEHVCTVHASCAHHGNKVMVHTNRASHGCEAINSLPEGVTGLESAREVAQELQAQPIGVAGTNVQQQQQQQQQQERQQRQRQWQQQDNAHILAKQQAACGLMQQDLRFLQGGMLQQAPLQQQQQQQLLQEAHWRWQRQHEDSQVHAQQQDKASPTPHHVPSCATAANLGTPTCTTLPSTSMRVGLPAIHALVEPVQLVLALWEAATSLLIQLLRIDAVLPARSPENQGPVLHKGRGTASRPVVRKGGMDTQQLGQSSDDSESGKDG